jgi:hypothetical protein
MRNSNTQEKKMAEMKRKRTMAAITDAGEKTLRVTSLGGDTNPRDLIELFAREHFHVVDASVRLIIPEDPNMTEGFVSLPAHEAWRARDWANKRDWRGRKLDVGIVGEDGL